MTRVLLTGGNGFLATHVLDTLLNRGHSVVATVRSKSKATDVRALFPNYGPDRLDFTFVSDIAEDGAFDSAVISVPPFEAVIHTASPYTFAIKDVQKDLLDPAIKGTTGILRSIKAHAPTVKRVIITSSFAAMIDRSKGFRPGYTYSEKDFNPITHEEALQDASWGYFGSKTFAEKSAWSFVETESPNFSITTINPPMIYGPAKQHVSSLDAINTSSQRMRDILQGKFKTEIAPTALPIFADVRDVALMHVLAMESESVAGQRIFTVAGFFDNRQMVDIVRKHFPTYAHRLPDESAKGGEVPGAIYGIDNSRAKQLLQKDFLSFEQCMTDLAQSLIDLGI